MTCVLHLLDHSLPEQDGYSFRSHAILTELAARGIDLEVITSPKQGESAEAEQVIDGITYRRTRAARGSASPGARGQLGTILATRAHAARVLRERAVDVVHAHSPCLNGLAALGHDARLLYEVRSSWEDAAVSIGATTEGSLRYRASRALETVVVRRADEIVVISAGLRDDLIARGVPPERITIVPNALPAKMFVPSRPEAVARLRGRLGLVEAKVIGFFGSFFEWEGVEALVEAMPAILAAVPAARLLLAGGGRQEPALRALVDARGLGAHVIFAGRIAHAEVPDYYGAADVMVYPRIPHRLTEMVTPLKPLEAMAQGTPVVASDIGGHRELIDDGRTGLLFAAGDLQALTETVVRVLTGRMDVDALTVRARSTVERERRWQSVAERYLPIYERLASRGRRGAGSGATMRAGRR